MTIPEAVTTPLLLCVERNEEGFLLDPGQWTEPLAHELASEAGIALITDRHWIVIRFMRERFLATGQCPTMRTIGKESGVPIKELYELFPKGPAKLAAKVGGIPKPHGCI